MSGLVQDLRYALRQLRKSVGFTTFAVMTLALGIGANTAVFTLVNAVMLQPIPVRDPNQLVVPRWSAHTAPHNISSSSFGDCARKTDSGGDVDSCSFSYPLFKNVRAQGLFSSIAGFAGPVQIDLSGNGPASIARGVLVSGEYFETLGVSAALGRTIQPSDEDPGAPAVVVLSYGFWQSAFGGALSVVGKTINLNTAAFTVIGVTEPTFTRLTPGTPVDFWVPIPQAAELGLPVANRTSDDSRNLWLTLIGRIKAGEPVAQSQAAMTALLRNDLLYGGKPSLKESDDPKVTILPAENALAGIRMSLGEPLWASMAAVAIGLFIMCANLAGLMLARALTRERELAMRLALGATRGRVIQQLLTESVILSLMGASVGALFAVWGDRGLVKFLSTAYRYRSPLEVGVHVNATVLAFTTAVAVFTGIGFGLAPALRGGRIDIAPRLKESSGTVFCSNRLGSRRFGLPGWLVVSQVTLSMVVVIAAGLLVRTLEKLRSIDPGFDTRNILLFSLDPDLAGYKREKAQPVYAEIERKLAALPGVVSASYSSDALLDGSLWTSGLHIEGQERSDTTETQMLAAGPGYFETMRVPILQGREFRDSDMSATQQVAVVNRSFVQKFLMSKYPIGSHFECSGQKYEIVGVVGDTKYEGLRSTTAPTAYIPLKEGRVTFALRSAVSPGYLVLAVRRVVNEVDSNLPVFQVRTQSQAVDRLLFSQRLMARLFSMVGVLALLLACIGLYGLLSYDVSRRRIEIGIRTALGARRQDVLRLVIRQGLLLVLGGLFCGITLACLLTRYLRSFLFGVQPMDLLSLVGSSAILAVVGLLACYIPARRAANVDPMVALRYE
ncbi:MAG: ABC transporter permease [Candidatus Sulfotelmatobacter sp.]